MDCKKDEAKSNDTNMIYEIGSCLRGVLTAGLDSLKGIYDLLSFHLKMKFDPQYAHEFRMSSARFVLAALKNPVEFAHRLYEATRSGLLKVYADLKTCGDEYVLAQTCRVVTYILSGAWTNAQARAGSASASMASKVAKEAIETVTEKATKETIESVAEKADDVSAVTTTQVQNFIRNTEAPTVAEIAVQRSQLDKFNEAVETLRKSLSETSDRCKRIEELYKRWMGLERTFPPNPEFEATQKMLAGELTSALAEKGIRAQVTNKMMLTTSEYHDIIKDLEYTKTKLRDLMGNPGSDPDKVSQLEIALRSRESVLKEFPPSYADMPYNFSVEVDLSSHPVLRKVRNSLGINEILIDLPTLHKHRGVAGGFRDRSRSIILGVNSVLSPQPMRSTTFLHELHHAANWQRLQRGEKGPLYGQLIAEDGFEFKVFDYKTYFSLDEITAFRRSLAHTEIALREMEQGRPPTIVGTEMISSTGFISRDIRKRFVGRKHN